MCLLLASGRPFPRRRGKKKTKPKFPCKSLIAPGYRATPPAPAGSAPASTTGSVPGSSPRVNPNLRRRLRAPRGGRLPGSTPGCAPGRPEPYTPVVVSTRGSAAGLYARVCPGSARASDGGCGLHAGVGWRVEPVAATRRPRRFNVITASLNNASVNFNVVIPIIILFTHWFFRRLGLAIIMVN